MTCSPCPLKLFIVSTSPIYARGLQELIGSSRIDGSSEIVLDPTAAPLLSDRAPDLALLAPRDWKELGRWIGPLRKRLPAVPWLILAELRMVGMFLQELDTQPCVIVDPTATPRDLSLAVQSAASGEWMHLRSELLSLFMRRGGLRLQARRARMPSAVELAVCCGVCLGLSNREIAEVLHLSESTIKTHLHRLTCRMEFANRAELGAVVQTALAWSP